MDTPPVGVRLVLALDAQDSTLWEAGVATIIASNAEDGDDTG